MTNIGPDSQIPDDRLAEMAHDLVSEAYQTHSKFADFALDPMKYLGEMDYDPYKHFPNTNVQTLASNELATTYRYTTDILNNPVPHELLIEPEEFYLDRLVAHIFRSVQDVLPPNVHPTQMFQYHPSVNVDEAAARFSQLRRMGLAEAVANGPVELFRANDSFVMPSVVAYEFDDRAILVGLSTVVERVGGFGSIFSQQVLGAN